MYSKIQKNILSRSLSELKVFQKIILWTQKDKKNI